MKTCSAQCKEIEKALELHSLTLQIKSSNQRLFFLQETIRGPSQAGFLVLGESLIPCCWAAHFIQHQIPAQYLTI